MADYNISLSSSPYYDLTEYELSQRYMQVLARPGFVIQARELEVTQGFLASAIKDIGDRVLKDGTILEGLELAVNLNSEQSYFSLTAGKVYIGGRVWPVDAVTEFNIGAPEQDPGTLGEITIDVLLQGVVVTEVDDPLLLSPALGHGNHNLPGAHRLRVDTSIATNSATGVTIYRLLNGEQLKLPPTGVLSQIESDLARRTFDESGNYLVNGLSLSLDGEDETAFSLQPAVKTTSVATINPNAHPYEAGWTNRITVPTPNFFDVSDIGRYVVIAESYPNAGSYEVVDVVTANEIEVAAQLSEAGFTNAPLVLKEAPQALRLRVEPGKAYVSGFEVEKPDRTSVSIPKSLTGRRQTNEPHSLVFRQHEYGFYNQPFKSLITSGFEGITVDALIGIGMQSLIAPSNHESGWGITTNKVSHPVVNSFGVSDTASIPGGGSFVRIIAISSNGIWEWHLDPGDPDYPGKWLPSPAAIEWTQDSGLPGGAGWSLVNNKIHWRGPAAPGGGAGQPSAGSQYKVVAVVTRTLERGKDFRIRSNASARMYPLPGAFTDVPLPGTSSLLFFPQTTIDLSDALTLTVNVDGVRVYVNFGAPEGSGDGNPDLVDGGVLLLPGTPGSPVLTAVPLNSIVNAINFVGARVGKPGIATAQYDSAGGGWVVLQSPIEGSLSTISIPTGGGNLALGFPDGYSVSGTDTPEDVISLGGYRIPSLIAGTGGIPSRSVTAVKVGANIASLSGLATTVDGVLLDVSGTRVLLTAQSTATQNGVWEVRSGAWVRPAEMATGLDVANSFLLVEEGDDEGGTKWRCTNTPGAAVVGTNNLTFAKVTTPLPVALGNYTFDADYEFGLARADLFVLDKDGNVVRREGEPDLPEKVIPPQRTLHTLELGSATVAPQASDVDIVNYQLQRLTMPELRAMRTRIENIEYDLAVLDLDRAGVEESGLMPTDLSGVLSDGFVGLSKADILFDEDGIKHDVAIDIDKRQILLSQDEEDSGAADDYAAPEIDEALTTADLAAGETIAVLPQAGETAVVAQTQATELFTLNRLGTYAHQPRIRLTPRYDNYPEALSLTQEELALAPGEAPEVQNIPVSHRHLNSWVQPRVTSDQEQKQIKGFGIRSGSDAGSGTRKSSDLVTTAASDFIVEAARVFLRRRKITIVGQGFLPNEDDLELFFDDRHLDMTDLDGSPPAPTTTGQGLIRAQADGSFAATFLIKRRFFRRKKVHTVRVVSRSLASSGASLTTYRTWLWRTESPEDSVFTAGQGFFPRKPALAPDGSSMAPLAQTFTVEKDSLLTKIDLYFGAIPAVNEFGAEGAPAITVQIRNVVNGLPGSIAYAEEVLQRDSFLPGEVDGSLGALPKTVTFRDPVYCAANQEYAIVFTTRSRSYSLAIGRIGGTPLGGGKAVTTQLFSVGKLFTNENGRDWIASDESDLKFKLYAATFTPAAPVELVFATITAAQSFTRLILAAEGSAMRGSSVAWYYSTDDGATWVSIVPFAITDLSPLDEKTSVKIKAVLTSTDATATPIVLKDTVSVALRRFQSEANYISKKVLLAPDSYDEVRQSFKANLGDSGVITPYFGYDDETGRTVWVESTVDETRSPVSLPDGFTEYFYKTHPVLPGVNHTEPAQVTGTTVPSITTPVFDLTGETDLAFQVVYWDEGNPAPTAPNSKTLTVTVDLSGVSPIDEAPAQDIVDAINAAAAAASVGTAVDLSEVAGRGPLGQITLTHPQSGGMLRNKITVTVANAALGFAASGGGLNHVDVGGLVTAAPSAAGGTLTPSTTYHYLIAATLGGGTDIQLLPDVDAISVTLGGADNRVVFTFQEGAIPALASGITIYRANTHNIGSAATFTLSNWKEVGDFACTNGTPDVAVFDNTLALSSATKPGEPPVTAAALTELTTFRARLKIAAPAPGSVPKVSPVVQDFKNVFVRVAP